MINVNQKNYGKSSSSLQELKQYLGKHMMSKRGDGWIGKNKNINAGKHKQLKLFIFLPWQLTQKISTVGII